MPGTVHFREAYVENIRSAGAMAAAGGTCWVVAAYLAALSPPYGASGSVGNRFVAEDAWSLAALPLLAVGAWRLTRAERGRMATWCDEVTEPTPASGRGGT